MTTVVEPAPAGAQDDLEGAGVVSSWADLVHAATADSVDPNRLGLAAGGAALDTLGAVLYPFDSLLQAGLGWLIEHIAFLHEPLDVLAGDPDEVRAQVHSWDLAGLELRTAAAELRSMVVPGWDGAAAAGQRGAVTELTAALNAGAEFADSLSRLLLTTGVAVGTVRALVRDLIAEFVSAVLQYLLAAGALAVLSAGGSLAGLLLAVIVRALDVADQIARQVSRLLDELAAASGAAGRIGAGLRQAADRAAAAAPELRVAGASLHRAAKAAGAPQLVEAGMQITDGGPDSTARSEPPR